MGPAYHKGVPLLGVSKNTDQVKIRKIGQNMNKLEGWA